MENQNNLPINTNEDNSVMREIFNVAVDECGLMPLVCFTFCVAIGASIGGLVGYRLFINTRN